MARDEVFQIRHDDFPAVGGDGGRALAVVNRMGMQVVVDFLDQIILSGFGYHHQIGTEDAGVASTTSIDDQLAWMVVDQNAGYAMVPLLLEVNLGVAAGGTLVMTMLELDKQKNRYSSGGTAQTPENLNGEDAQSFNGSGYVGTDVATAAKSAVPDSIELARKEWLENALADTIGYPMASNPVVYSAKNRPLAVVHDAGSLVVHHGATTADVTGYGVIQFAQFANSALK